jgi:hypothetical protein
MFVIFTCKASLSIARAAVPMLGTFLGGGDAADSKIIFMKL